MKAILMSDRPKWCALMMNGDKTVEVRKGTALYKAIQKLIDEYGYADIYVYCTKGKDDLRKSKWFGDYILPPKMSNYRDRVLNGKVPFKFRCYKVEEIGMWNFSEYGTKELNEFEHEVAIRDNVRGYIYEFKKLAKAPQSWQFIKTGE